MGSPAWLALWDKDNGVIFRSFIIALLFACTAFLSAPQTTYAQSATASSQTTEDSSSETFVLHTEDEIETAYRALKRNDKYQDELAEPIPRKPRSNANIATGRFFDGLFSFLAPIFKIIFYLGMGALILGAVYLIGRAVYETRFALPVIKKDEDAEEIPLYQPAEAQARILLDEVDRLAAEGRYGEAVHTLLFRSIQDIDRNRPNVVRRSLTSREIGSLSVLTMEARRAFSTIAGVSELAHFGGVSVNEAGFQTARNAYADLTGQTATPRKKSRR